MPDLFCKRQTDCTSCVNHHQDLIHYRYHHKGEKVAKENCTFNTIYFLINGVLTIDSSEFSNQTFSDGQFILQPMGSAIGFSAVADSEVIVYNFDLPPRVCPNHFDKSIELAQEEISSSSIMEMNFPLRLFIQNLKVSLNNELMCVKFLRAKQMEFYYLLNHYYSDKEIAEFYAPIFKSDKKFRYFVLENYNKVKDVEDFAKLGNYPVSSFRRLFKETFGVPAYQWMLKKRCEDIFHDLSINKFTVTEVSKKYGFDSLSNFSHFCKTNFKISPRDIRNIKSEEEDI